MARFYLLHLNPQAKGLVDRYAVMQIMEDGTFSPLWGEADEGKTCNDNPHKAAKAWPHMVYRPRPERGPDTLPAFHFAIRGYGFNKAQDLAQSLADKLGEDIELIPVTGWNSSAVKATYRPRA